LFVIISGVRFFFFSVLYKQLIWVDLMILTWDLGVWSSSRSHVRFSSVSIWVG